MKRYGITLETGAEAAAAMQRTDYNDVDSPMQVTQQEHQSQGPQMQDSSDGTG
ncbi:hypothetical protein BDR04DRAFT_1107490 [Suillus decipiens]|nr:hypothetical protein BDR04DRAFT_1107490 [Suillus decipiens]